LLIERFRNTVQRAFYRKGTKKKMVLDQWLGELKKSHSDNHMAEKKKQETITFTNFFKIK